MLLVTGLSAYRLTLICRQDHSWASPYVHPRYHVSQSRLGTPFTTRSCEAMASSHNLQPNDTFCRIQHLLHLLRPLRMWKPKEFRHAHAGWPMFKQERRRHNSLHSRTFDSLIRCFESYTVHRVQSPPPSTVLLLRCRSY